MFALGRQLVNWAFDLSDFDLRLSEPNSAYWFCLRLALVPRLLWGTKPQPMAGKEDTALGKFLHRDTLAAPREAANARNDWYPVGY